jgi:hypothetical protein
MNDENSGSAVIRWWAMLVVGTAAALLIAWLARVSGVPLRTVLSIAVGAAALGWLIVLVAVPWNLYFAARRVVTEQAVSRGREITVRAEQEAEARRIARRMLWFALGGHLCTAAVTAVITYYSGNALGYYITAFYLLSATIRPAAAYFAHLRQRLSALSRESLHPRDDIITLRQRVDRLDGSVKELTDSLPGVQRGVTDDLRRTEARLADDSSHTRDVLTTDLARLQDAQAADGVAARSRAADLARRIDAIGRQIEVTLDGISDHQELRAGLRALVRMVRAEPT